MIYVGMVAAIFDVMGRVGVPIIANSREDAPEKRTFHEKFTLKSREYKYGDKYYLVLADANDEKNILQQYEFMIDIAFVDDFGFYAAFMFLFVFIMYSLYSRIIEICTSSVFVPVYIAFYLFNICWNVEVLMTSFFSWFFSSLPIIVILYMFEKYHLIEVKMKFETE